MPSDPLATPPNANPALVYIVNNLYQTDCLIACFFTGKRNKTISCWLGEDEEVRLGPLWYWAMIWLWWPVNWVGYTFFGQADHCKQSVGPFLVAEDQP